MKLKSIIFGLALLTVANAAGEIGNWTETFSTKIGVIQHEPTYVKWGGMQCGSLNLSSPVVNGVQLLAPLKLLSNTSRDEFVAALKLSGIYTGQ